MEFNLKPKLQAFLEVCLYEKLRSLSFPKQLFSNKILINK